MKASHHAASRFQHENGNSRAAQEPYYTEWSVETSSRFASCRAKLYVTLILDPSIIRNPLSSADDRTIRPPLDLAARNCNFWR
jgi:hypothetical protein